MPADAAEPAAPHPQSPDPATPAEAAEAARPAGQPVPKAAARTAGVSGTTGVARPAGMTGGIGCSALLLPVFAVVAAVLCFAAGVWSTTTGCTPNGSALCSANGPWLTFGLPLFVAPLVAAVTATGAVLAKRHRSTWLAVGYAVVFISLVVGLVSANTGAG